MDNKSLDEQLEVILMEIYIDIDIDRYRYRYRKEKREITGIFDFGLFSKEELLKDDANAFFAYIYRI